MSSEAGTMPCTVCGNVSALMCQRCGEPYCNDVCQRKDWQRHKYFCIIMPPLVTLHLVKPGISQRTLETGSFGCSLESMLNEAINQNNCRSDGSEAAKPIKLSTAWRDHLKPPENDFFDCLVTYIEKDGSFWVVAESNTERLERLTSIMVRSVQNKKPCSFEMIDIGDLVGVLNDKQMYRAEVLSLDANAKRVEVRLVDYGTITIVDVQDVYLAVPRMAEMNAFAFRVMLSTKAAVDANKRLTLCLLGSNNIDGIYQVQQKFTKSIPLNLAVQVLASNPKVVLIRTFEHNDVLKEPQVALLQIKKPDNPNDELNSYLSNKSGSNFTEPFPEKLRTFFLAARTKQGYRRAFLIDFIEKPAKFLVYEMDHGQISVTDEVRRIPPEFLDHPLGAVAMTLADANKRSLKPILTQCSGNLSIMIEKEYLHERNNDKLRSARATLLANNDEVCPVRIDTFTGRIAELGLKYWEESIENGSLVYISHVQNYHTICISSVVTKEYTDIFKSLEAKCLPFSPNSNIPIGCIVLVVCPNRGYYRAEVIAEQEKGLYGVRNIDNTSAHRVPASHLRKSCAFLENLPVSRCRSSIKTICSIPSEVVPQNTTAMRLLLNLYEQKTSLTVQFTDLECTSLDLLDDTVEPASLVARMLPMMFTPSAIELKPAQNLPGPLLIAPDSVEPESSSIVGLPPLPPSPPNTPLVESTSCKRIKRHYFEDLKRDLLPLGENIKIMVLNAIGLHATGQITACYFSSEMVAETFQNLLDLVVQKGSDESISAGYQPDIGEMCLTLFTEDNSWYRGVCLKVKGHEAEILYCDFGNSEIVPLSRIKPIPTELLQTVYATKCFVFGFDKSKDFMALEEYLAAKTNIVCTVLEGSETNTRLVKIPELDKILSHELN